MAWRKCDKNYQWRVKSATASVPPSPPPTHASPTPAAAPATNDPATFAVSSTKRSKAKLPGLDLFSGKRTGSTATAFLDHLDTNFIDPNAVDWAISQLKSPPQARDL
ncbi:hypothetical protein BROUX41_004375 [Berkeleyomyces rouxiae]